MKAYPRFDEIKWLDDDDDDDNIGPLNIIDFHEIDNI